MNSSRHADSRSDALTKHVITVTLGLAMNCVNGAFVYTFFQNQEFQQQPRYVLYVHLVINDMILLTCAVALQIMTFTITLGFTPCCILLIISITINKNGPLNLAGMAVERYIAVCRPLRHVQVCTLRRTYMVIALIWAVSFVTTFPNVIITLATQPLSVFSGSIMCYPLYMFNTLHHEALSIVSQVLLFSFVFLTVIVTYVKVLFAAQAASGSSRASARNARNTIALHGVQLLICMLSFISPLINIVLLAALPSDRVNILYCSFLLNNVLPRLLSPLIYGVRDKKFSSHVRMHFFCKRCRAVEKKRLKLTGAHRRSRLWICQ